VRLAAIDLGTNSVHMVVANVTPDGRIEVIDRVKEMVRLGQRAFTTGKLSPETMELASRTLKTFGRLARVRRVERLRAVATSAVREARNGERFVQRLRRETGLPIEIISGADEARLIFRAARHALGLNGGPHLLVDVGGGSVELSLAQDGRPLWMRSLPLGVARLTQQFLIKDPPSASEVRELEHHLHHELDDLLMRVRRAGAWVRSARRGPSIRWRRWRSRREARTRRGFTAPAPRASRSPASASASCRSTPRSGRRCPAWTPSAPT